MPTAERGAYTKKSKSAPAADFMSASLPTRCSCALVLGAQSPLLRSCSRIIIRSSQKLKSFILVRDITKLKLKLPYKLLRMFKCSKDTSMLGDHPLYNNRLSYDEI